jgi:hypothetical protein
VHARRLLTLLEHRLQCGQHLGAPPPLPLVGRHRGSDGSILCAGTTKGTDSLALDVSIFGSSSHHSLIGISLTLEFR